MRIKSIRINSLSVLIFRMYLLCLLLKQRVFCLNKTSPRYKTKFGEDWTEVTVIQFIRTRRSSDTEPYQVPDVPVAKGSGDLSQAKKNHIKAMLKFMPPDYKTFMSNMLLFSLSCLMLIKMFLLTIILSFQKNSFQKFYLALSKVVPLFHYILPISCKNIFSFCNILADQSML